MSDAALREALEELLGEPVQVLRRRPIPYGSTYAIEELEAVHAGGVRRLVFKDLSAPAVSGAKPALAVDPQREVAAYRDVLGPRRIDAPTCLGAIADAATGRYWLFLERIEGDLLWQVGTPETWDLAAALLARMHAQGAPPAASPLVRYDAEWFRLWPRRARAITGAASLDRVIDGYDRVIERLTSWPVTFVHGEFYPSNVIVQRSSDGPRVRPVDWEMAGAGPGLLDVAALTAGHWSDAEAERLALAYLAGWQPQGAGPERDDFLDALEHCRLHVALQWLGWSETWSPPVEHAQDWLAIALRHAERLGL